MNSTKQWQITIILLYIFTSSLKGFANTNKHILRYLKTREILCLLRKQRHKDDDWLSQGQATGESSH